MQTFPTDIINKDTPQDQTIVSKVVSKIPDEDIKKQIATLIDPENPINWNWYKHLWSSIVSKLPSDVSMHVSALLSIPYGVPAAIVLGIHHATTAAITLNLHRNKTHKSTKLDPLLVVASEVLIRVWSTIVPKEWVAAHTQHHMESDNTWDMDSEDLWDPHTPQAVSSDGHMRFLKQYFIPSEKKDYFESIDIMYDQSKPWFIDEGKVPLSRVKIEWEKPWVIARYGPSLWLFGSYVAMFWVQQALTMAVAHAALWNLTVTLVNGYWHGAEQKKEWNRGDYSQNITYNGDAKIWKMWNEYLRFQCVWEEHHGNHHDAMKSADITLWDPDQVDQWYKYLLSLQESWLAWDIKTSKTNAS